MSATEPRTFDPETDRAPLDSYAWPGGYPIIYWDTANGDGFCGKHAWPVLVREDPMPNLEAAIFWEGAPEWCEEGSHWIDSAYGDPETTDNA